MHRRLRPLRCARERYTQAEIRHGLGFLASGLTTNGYSELDKVLAVRYLGPGPAGAYAVAYRMASMLAMPMVSLVQVSQARIFRHARDPQSPELRRLLFTVGLTVLAAAFLAGILLMLVAPLLVLLLGPAFAPATQAARLLAPLLPLLCLRLLVVTLLTDWVGRHCVPAWKCWRSC